MNGFQEVCFQEIQKWGGDFPSTAPYSTNEGKLNLGTYKEGYYGEEDLQGKRFAWEWCSKVTVTKG